MRLAQEVHWLLRTFRPIYWSPLQSKKVLTQIPSFVFLLHRTCSWDENSKKERTIPGTPYARVASRYCVSVNSAAVEKCTPFYGIRSVTCCCFQLSDAPRLVELQQYPGFFTSQLTPLPHCLHVSDVLERVVSAQNLKAKVRFWKQQYVIGSVATGAFESSVPQSIVVPRKCFITFIKIIIKTKTLLPKNAFCTSKPQNLPTGLYRINKYREVSVEFFMFLWMPYSICAHLSSVVVLVKITVRLAFFNFLQDLFIYSTIFFSFIF